MFGLLVSIVSTTAEPSICAVEMQEMVPRAVSQQNPGGEGGHICAPLWASLSLLQVINPYLGDLQLLLECCGEAQGLAQQAANMLNENQYTSPIEDNLKKDGGCDKLQVEWHASLQPQGLTSTKLLPQNDWIMIGGSPYFFWILWQKDPFEMQQMSIRGVTQA